MICNRCLRAASRNMFSVPRPSIAPKVFRTYASSSDPKTISPNAATQPAPRQGTPDSSHKPPAATSTAAAQPFSAPLQPSPKKNPTIPKGTKVTKSPAVTISGVPAGTPLKGLNLEKDKSDPLAKEDWEYPSWLWGCLDAGKKDDKAAGKDIGDVFSKSKKQRRLAAKRQRKLALSDPESLAPKIPIYEQTIDLPSGDGTIEGAIEAGKSRLDLNKAMRGKRRSSIKEANFLKAMG